MAERVQLIIDPLTREKIELDLPLSFRTDPAEMRAAVGLPSFVDLSDPTAAKAVALVFAARQEKPPVQLAFFGGVANRLVAPSSNDPSLGLRHPLHDMDVTCLHRQLKAVRKFLAEVWIRQGSALRIFETAGDRIFNSLGEGRRFRFHDLRAQEKDQIDLGTVDLLADEFRFCHRLDLRSDIEQAHKNGWTLSPTLLLLAKLQFIQRIPAADAEAVRVRVLAPFGRREVLIGPEAKDIQDVLALLIDCPMNGLPSAISIPRFEEILAADWGLWKTLGLNLLLVERSSILSGLPDEIQGVVREKLSRLRSAAERLAPKRRLGFSSSPWWQDVDALPTVDRSVSVS